ncbi:sodium-coupled monocarboxylate transporter 2-like [Mercenaria mercenaria]|uniref:sodium-coupled monocarboxylate transporter 2-like n=1 Tax=Mercenaria mercenaria TaxID=6596 RepID=UPI00234ECB32|nr:sodium-coupled monocarboxylate transporter 2-like [Mercenaria mercenaria]
MSVRKESTFSAADYVVFVGTLLVSFSIGVFFAIWERKKNTPTDYFLAGRNFNTLPVALSFIVTFQSSLMIIGVPAEGYAYGMKMLYYVVGVITAYIFAGIFIVPVFHPLRLTSVYEYFYLRFGDNVLRYLTLTSGVLYNIFYMGTVTYGTCVALEVVMGIPFWGTIIIYTTVTAVYTSIGGIKAVIWTDVFQMLIMLTGIIAVLIKSTVDVGGTANIIKYAGDRFDAADFRFDPTIRYQFWNTSFGSFSIMLICTYMQPAMQRVYSTPSVKSARTLYFISAPLYALFLSMAALEGAFIFAYFVSKRCDILDGGLVENINEILPFTIQQLFSDYPGFAGLFIASLSSAALSTLSSCLSSLSAVTYVDIIKVNFPNIGVYKATNISKVLVLFYGLVAMLLAFGIALIPGTIHAIFAGFMGCIDGPTCGVFVLSSMWRRSTSKGLFIGAIAGFCVSLWLNVGQTFTNLPSYPYLPPGPTDNCSSFLDQAWNATDFSYVQNTEMPTTEMPTTDMSTSSPEKTVLETIYSISFILFSFIGFATSLVFGVVFSLLTSPPKVINESCIFSFQKHIIDDLFKPKVTRDEMAKDTTEMEFFVKKE